MPLENCGGSARSSAAYLLSLGWQAPSLKNWKQTSGQVKPWNFTQVEDRYAILQAMQHKSYRIGKEELPSLTSALNWRRVLIGMGQSCPSRGQECRSPVKPSGKVLSGQARMPGVPGVKNLLVQALNVGVRLVGR